MSIKTFPNLIFPFWLYERVHLIQQFSISKRAEGGKTTINEDFHFSKRFFEYEVTRGLEGKLTIEDEMSFIEIHGNQTFPRIIPTALRVNYTYSLVSKKYSKS